MVLCNEWWCGMFSVDRPPRSNGSRVHVFRALVAFIVLGVLGAACQSDDDASSPEERRRPSILLIVSDDQRWTASPTCLRSTGGRSGRDSTSRSSTNPMLSSPHDLSPDATRIDMESRPSRDGGDLDESVTIATLLQDAGYRTGLYGKYLNAYPFGRGQLCAPGLGRVRRLRGGDRVLRIHAQRKWHAGRVRTRSGRLFDRCLRKQGPRVHLADPMPRSPSSSIWPSMLPTSP